MVLEALLTVISYFSRGWNPPLALTNQVHGWPTMFVAINQLSPVRTGSNWNFLRPLPEPKLWGVGSTTAGAGAEDR